MNSDKIRNFFIIKIDKNINKNNKKQYSNAYFKSFISFYYYQLFTKLNKNILNEEFIKLYGTDKYFKFFYNNFIDNQNILIFTIYNQIPIEFLPFPNKKYYYYFPLITFYDGELYSKSKIILDKNLISNKITHRDHIFDIYMKTDKDYPNKNMMKEIQNSLKNKKMIEDEIITLNFPIKFIKMLPNNYLNNKVILLLIDKRLIICDNFIKKENNIILNNFYQKINRNFYKLFKNLTININNLKYLSIFDKFNHKSLLKIYTTLFLKKDELLYNEKNIE